MDYNKRFRLDGKAALVTGAARGIGAAIAEALVQAGAAVLYLASDASRWVTGSELVVDGGYIAA